MSQIKSKNTKIELSLRKQLRLAGFNNYRITTKIPGKPDVYFPKYKLAIFVDGCFWHRCPKCYKSPKSNKEYWSRKIKRNEQRDKEIARALKKQGVSILRFWEHQLHDNLNRVVSKISREITKNENRP